MYRNKVIATKCRNIIAVCVCLNLLVNVGGEILYPNGTAEVPFSRSGKNLLLKTYQEQDYENDDDDGIFENIKFEDVVEDAISGPVFRFDKYYRLSEIYAFMEYLRLKYKNLVQIMIIGRTWEDRSIKTLKISNGNINNSAIWIDGGIHAREWISVTSVYYAMYTLLSNWHNLAPQLQNVDYYLTPILNPDGYEFTHSKQNRLWRKNKRKLNDNCYGIDLNRNFPYKWGHRHYSMQDSSYGGSKQLCGDTYAGSEPLSEPESKAVTNFITHFQHSIKGFITFHSFGPAILYPYGYEPRVPKDAGKFHYVGMKAARKILNVTGMSYEVETGSMLAYSFAGNSMDWAYKVAEIPYSYLIELRSNNTFELPPSEIVLAGKEAHKWQSREKQLLEENHKLSQETSNGSTQKLRTLQAKLNTANDIINKLNDNLNHATTEWNKREAKLIDECNHLKYQLQNTPKAIAPDVERLQEQLKDSQEMNLKIKFDFDACKDKCTALETLCADLKKIIMDEQIADKVYANDNIPATVKQFLSSSSNSVINTLSHVFGCLSKSSSRSRYNSYSGQKDNWNKKELFTTNESLMINDISRSHEHTELLKGLIKEKEQLKKENMDLNRQVKELEKIVRRRAHSTFSNVSEIMRGDELKQNEQDNETIQNLKKELIEKQHSIIELKNQLIESKAKYDQNLLSLQEKVVGVQEESIKLKDELEKKKGVVAGTHGPKCKKRGRTCDPPTPTTRNLRTELSAKEREVQTLSKQLDELKKTNRKLIKERGHYVSYLSSKEQSIDEIHLPSKVGSTANSEINSPEKPNVEFKNINKEVSKPYDEMEQNGIPNTKRKSSICNGNNNEVKEEEKVPSNNENETGKGDYKFLSDKLNHLETKHQNLQQITCDLLSLLTKEGIQDGHKVVETMQNNDELNRFVNALKDFNK